jgi:SAM-dependent methyltransferase
VRETVLEQSTKWDSTPFERWRSGANEGHWYGYAADFAGSNLPKGDGSCLVIGSPEVEVNRIQSLGWNVTYLDVRNPPFKVSHVKGDAIRMPFSDNTFDCLSSTCVLTHVGLGRYGDEVSEDGDEIALREMSRCMKPGALASIMFGGCFDGEGVVRIGKAHRIYSTSETERMVKNAGLELLKTGYWKRGPELSKDPHREDYISVLVRKC